MNTQDGIKPARLKWRRSTDHKRRQTHEAEAMSHDMGTPFNWRIKTIRPPVGGYKWVEAHDKELVPHVGIWRTWQTLSEAKAAIQKDNDLLAAQLIIEAEGGAL